MSPPQSSSTTMMTMMLMMLVPMNQHHEWTATTVLVVVLVSKPSRWICDSMVHGGVVVLVLRIAFLLSFLPSFCMMYWYLILCDWCLSLLTFLLYEGVPSMRGL
jgi:hypothetical protein